MALSQKDLDALDQAIASGTLEVEFDGRRQRYQNTEALLKARSHVESVLRNSSGTSRRSSFQFTFTTSRGD
jgi:RecB family exonuclease